MSRPAPSLRATAAWRRPSALAAKEGLATNTELAVRLLSLHRGGKIRSLLQGFGTLTVLAILAYFLYRNRAQFQETNFSLDYKLVALSSLFWLGSYLLFALGWKLTLNALGSPIGWWGASRIWFLSQGLKYIPGSVVYAVGRVYMAGESGVQATPAALGLALESFLALTSGLLLSLFFLPRELWSGLPFLFVALALVILVIVFLLLPPLLDRLPTRWRKTGSASLDYKSLGLLFGFFLLVWLVTGSACYLSFRSLGQTFPLEPLQVMGLYALSWAAGLVAVFAPGGMGVRDGLVILLLSRLVPLPLAALGAGIIRVQALAVESLLALLALKVWPGRPDPLERRGLAQHVATDL